MNYLFFTNEQFVHIINTKESPMMDEKDSFDFQTEILEMERHGEVTRTFRRLDPERQQEVIAAVLAEVTEKGPTNLNVRDVAGRARASIGSIYQYFTSREGLLAFAATFVARAINALFSFSQPYLNQMPLREGLKQYVTEGIRMSRAQISVMRFAGRAAYQGDVELRDTLVVPVAAEMRRTIEGMLLAAQQRGEIRSDVDIQANARVVNGLFITLIDSEILPYLNYYFQVSDENMPFERVLNAAVDLMLRGMGETPGSEVKE
jgi:AcrR family transcriptional regulator